MPKVFVNTIAVSQEVVENVALAHLTHQLVIPSIAVVSTLDSKNYYLLKASMILF